MSNYKIKQYSYDQAKKLNVELKSSTNPKKKIDVYKNNKKIASIGAIGYYDYPTYMEKDKTLAKKRKKLYYKRHAGNVDNKDKNGFYASRILW